MGYKSKYKGSEIDSLLDKSKNDYEVKQYTDYAEYIADTSRSSNTISFVGQDNSIWVQGKQYSMNAGCCVGSSETNTPNSAWYLVAESNVSWFGDDMNMLVYCGDYLLSKNAGLFALNIRFQSASDITIRLFQWIAKIGDTPLLRVAINGTNIKLYARVMGGEYRGANFTVLSSKADYTNSLKSPNTFIFADNNVYETTEPSGTDIADVPYLLKDGTAATATKVLQTNSVLNKERRVLLGEDNDNTQQDQVCKSAGLTYNPSTKTLTVTNIAGLADAAKKVSNKLLLTVNGSTTEYDGSKGERVKIATSKTHAVIAQGYGINWTSPPTGVSTPGVALTIEPYSMSVDTLNDGDTILMQIPTTLTNTSAYPLYFQIDATRGTEAGNLIPIIRGQSAGTPVQWIASTTLTNGFYMFVYSVKLGGLIFMYRNTLTSGK